jgi:hypothetical protein
MNRITYGTHGAPAPQRVPFEATSKTPTYMPPLATLYDRRGGQRLFLLLALLLALAVSTPALLADEYFLAKDLTGVWTQTYVESPNYLALVTFHRDGTADLDFQGDLVFNPVQSHSHGLWKETGYLTFIANFKLLDVNHDASLYGTTLLLFRYKLYPSGDQFDTTLFIRETLTDGQVVNIPPLYAHGVRLVLEEPPQ